MAKTGEENEMHAYSLSEGHEHVQQHGFLPRGHVSHTGSARHRLLPDAKS